MPAYVIVDTDILIDVSRGAAEALAALSHGLLIADALIAATALYGDQSLISKNQRDYRFITGLQLLSYPQPFTL
jgi:predicted nucleic acid-binding protein